MDNLAQNIMVESPAIPGIWGAIFQTLCAVIIIANFTLATGKEKTYTKQVLQFLVLLTLPHTLHYALSSYVADGGEVSPTAITKIINLTIYPYLVIFAYFCASSVLLYVNIMDGKATKDDANVKHKKGNRSHRS